MKQLIMCTGLPGSGKTTWAKQHEDVFTGKGLRVNKDDIRTKFEADGWQWSPNKERHVIIERDRQINEAFVLGAHTVISDDTNFGRKHKVRLEQLARENGAQFVIKRFDTSVDECIRRDSLRTDKAHVGEAVIRKMAAQRSPSVAPTDYDYTVVPYVVPVDAMKAIICDLDGTLSLFEKKGHRGPFDATRCDEDDVNVPIKRMLEIYYRFMNYQIIYLSGRMEKFRAPTQTFLRKHHCPPGPLHMRKTDDYRTDWIIKGELFDAHVRDKYHVDFVLDDRDQVVKFWRSIGLTCLQVADGAF